MAQEPAVVIIARHGARLDAADQNWHLSTPTPYDPPLTYGGWNQCRALGIRIASLLHAREQVFNDSTIEPPVPNGVRSRDFADQDGISSGEGSTGKKRKRRKHKVVIHSSPFLRCLQTSVAISAGMAQFQPGMSGNGTTKSRLPSNMHSSSPRLRALDGFGSPSAGLTPIAEPRQDFAHVMARKALGEQQQQQKRHRRSKMRVDAFLGEWLNPQYFDQITPPPPSAMMVASAKGALITNETVDAYTPTVSARAPAAGSLWGGASAKSMSDSNSLDDWQHVQESLPPPTSRRDRASSVNSASSNESASVSGRKSPFRSGHVLHSTTSTTPKADTSVYNPPTPHYAVSNSDQIPRGYTAHARNATVNVDYGWDSSRLPQGWGDGGELGEEWSSMHKRFRRGLNHLVDWYGHHGVDDRAEDAMGFDQAEKHADHEEDSDEQEDLVVILVTHGAGSNALIGALTGQPVLLDVGMASLTMAVRKEDAPSVRSASDGIDEHRRPSSQEMPLSALYDMKLVASSEHLRPGYDPSRPSLAALSPVVQPLRSASTTALPTISSAASAANDKSQSALLGSIRRPSKLDTTAPVSSGTAMSSVQRRSTEPRSGIDHESPVTLPCSLPLPTSSLSNTGLWTPPGAATTKTNGTEKGERKNSFSSLDVSQVKEGEHTASPTGSRHGGTNGDATTLASAPTAVNGALDSTHYHAFPTTATTSSTSPKTLPPTTSPKSSPPATAKANGTPPFSAVTSDGTIGAPLTTTPSSHSERDAVPDLPVVETKIPDVLKRGLSQKGLWGSRPKGDQVLRSQGLGPKRRWTLVGEK